MNYDEHANLNHSVLARAACGLLTGVTREAKDLRIEDAEPTVEQHIAAYVLAQEGFVVWTWLGKRGEWVAVPTPAGRQLLGTWDEEARRVPLPRAGAL